MNEYSIYGDIGMCLKDIGSKHGSVFLSVHSVSRLCSLSCVVWFHQSEQEEEEKKETTWLFSPPPEATKILSTAVSLVSQLSTFTSPAITTGYLTYPECNLASLTYPECNIFYALQFAKILYHVAVLQNKSENSKRIQKLKIITIFSEEKKLEKYGGK